jgi:hypothetical protein
VGKVFYDDVWGNVPVPSPAKYPRLSDAIAGGLYHPNCKDIHTTYFEGISTPPEPMTEAEKKEAARVYDLEQRQRYNERQIRRYKRLYSGSVDAENKTKYFKKLEEWQGTQRSFVKANGDVLKRRYENEKLRVADFPAPPKTDVFKNDKTVLTNAGKGDNISSGAISGGRNPFGKKAKEHAVRYYESVRKMTTDSARIAQNLDLPQEDIEAVKNFIFFEEHDLGNGIMERFEPDYMMAESWQRLINGTQETHDVTLIKHEILERQLMNSGLSQEEAHIKASEQFNYAKEASEYYAKIKKYKTE